MLTAYGQDAEDIRGRINLACSRLQPCFWLQCEISLRTKGRINQADMRLILLYGCETWPIRVAEGTMLAIFHNDSTRRMLNVRGSDCALKEQLWLRNRPSRISPQLDQRRLR